MLKIHSIETFGTHEGPGIRLVLFLQGCMFRCLYCHNPDTWDLRAGTLMPITDLVKRAEKEKAYFGKKGGVTASGGEPMVQRVALTGLFSRLQKSGIHTALDTNGYFCDTPARKLLQFTDLVILDVKHIDEKKHLLLTGQSNQPTLQFARYLKEIKKPTWLRFVLVPGYTDDPEDIKNWCEYFSGYPNVQRVEILPYHTFGAYKYEKIGIKNPLSNTLPPTEKQVAAARKIFDSHFQNVFIR